MDNKTQELIITMELHSFEGILVLLFGYTTLKKFLIVFIT